MKKKEFFNKALPKWPALIVKGEPVSQQQAMEIILRTDLLHFSSNEHEFDQQLNEYFYDIKIAKPGWNSREKAIMEKLSITEKTPGSFMKTIEYEDSKKAEVGHIPLEYLYNSRIVSSWIGGAHGWCDWEGNIETNNYNIGKWPSVEEVYKEWVSIAKEFPFLDLRCQLLNHESGYPDMVQDPQPVVEFIVKGGKVKMIEPIEFMKSDESEERPDFFFNRSEIGCTFLQFMTAVQYVKGKR